MRSWKFSQFSHFRCKSRTLLYMYTKKDILSKFESMYGSAKSFSLLICGLAHVDACSCMYILASVSEEINHHRVCHQQQRGGFRAVSSQLVRLKGKNENSKFDLVIPSRDFSVHPCMRESPRVCVSAVKYILPFSICCAFSTFGAIVSLA